MFMVGLLLNRATSGDVRDVLLAKVPALHPLRQWTVGYYLSNLSRDVREVRWLREMPLAGRLEYLDSPYEFFRTVVAGSRDLPPWAVDRLMTDDSTMVRRVTAAHHDSVSGAALEELLVSHGESREFRRSLTGHPRFPRDAFLRFAHSRDSGLRAIACSYPDLPAPLVADIATDPAPGTREAAARHPNVPSRRSGGCPWPTCMRFSTPSAGCQAYCRSSPLTADAYRLTTTSATRGSFANGAAMNASGSASRANRAIRSGSRPGARNHDATTRC